MEVFSRTNRGGHNVRWMSNERFIIESSDVGSIELTKKDGVWVEGNPLDYPSPSGRYLAYCYWTSLYPKMAVVEVSGHGTNDFLVRLEDGFRIDDLIDCIEWKSDTSFIVKTVEGNRLVEKDDEDRWIVSKQIQRNP